MDREKVGTQQKALAINLDARKYGTFAEIGAGQEVVRWFFHVGGAAGTIAKSMSAYDMGVSDAIYGPAPRYVSRQRLQTMLDYEYGLVVERLDAQRGSETDFFVFADTVAARNYKGTNESHGWMGVKFQTQPHREPSQIVLHVRMLDKENASQQEALGIVGVNLIYGAFFSHTEPDRLMESLLDNLTPERIEIDMIKFSGPEFQAVDHRLMSLKLVQLELSNAAMFSADGEVLQPSEVLYKKPILVERGSFRPVTHVNLEQPPGQRRSRLRRFPRPRGDPGCLRRDHLDLQLLRILPPGRLSRALHHQTDRHRDGDPEPAGALRRTVLSASGRRHTGVVRPALQERSEALHLPAQRPTDGAAGHGAKAESRAAPAEPVRAPRRKRLHRIDRLLHQGLSADLFARCAGQNPRGRSGLGSDGARAGGQDDQGA
jgi:hypothetical protein